jgi:hypothetical protein
MVQEQLIKDNFESLHAPEQGPTGRIILKFFALWLGSLAILVGIALLTNIEWARRHVETAIRQSFHRQVRLGRLSWSFGLHGLAIDSDRFVMLEKDGGPFISSGPSEIGIAFLPLFQKRLVIKHLQFEHPEVFAVKVGEKNWNFSDLITEHPEIHMVQIENGLLHLRNRCPTRNPESTASPDWQSYDIKDIKLSVTLPNRNRNWPFFLSCKIPLSGEAGKVYETSVRLCATGKGPFKEWRDNKYSIDLQLQNFDPSQFRPLYAGLPRLKGICDLHFKGEGIFAQGFAAQASGKFDNLKMAGFEDKELALEKAEASCALVIAPQKIEWKDLKLTLSDWKLASEGKLFDWQKESPSYQARIGGELNDLKGFFNKVISCFVPAETFLAHKKFADSKLEKLKQTPPQGEAVGSALIELRLEGSRQAHNVATCIKAAGIPLSQLVDEELGNDFIAAFKLNPAAPISGELNIDPGRRLEVKNLEIPLEDSKLKLTGFLDGKSGHCEFDFAADNLSFETFKKRLSADNEFIKALGGTGSRGKSYSLSGKLDVKGKYKQDGARPEIFAESTLKGLRLFRQSVSAPTCSNIRGKIYYENGVVRLKQLSGNTAGGPGNPPGDFLVNGSFDLKIPTSTDIDLHAHEISIVQLKDWLKRCGVKFPLGTFDRLSGDVHELKAHLNARSSVPLTTFSINPADLVLDLPCRAGDASPMQLRLSSGSISYANNELTARDVTLTGRGGKLVISGNMQGSLDALKLSQAHLKTDGFDLGDLQSMVKGNLSQPRPNQPLPEFMLPSPQSAMHGRVYGDINYVAQGASAGISGVAGFFNVGAKFGKSQVAVEKLSGVSVITRDQLVFQETSGQIGKSVFSLDGVISNYAAANSSWQGQLRGQFYPDEVDAIMGNLGHGIALDSLSREALNLRVTGSGDRNSANCSFRGRASTSYGCSLKTAFGTFHQPKGRPLFFHGGLALSTAESQIALNNFQLTSGSENIQASGTFKWATEKEEKPDYLTFSLSTPAPVRSATLAEIISQKSTANPMLIEGTSQLNLKVEGPVNDLVLSGSISADKNALPALHVDNLTGKLDLPGWHLCKSASDLNNSSAKLQLLNLSMGGLTLHDAGASLSMDSNDRIIIKDFNAALSGGKLTVSGFYDQQNQSCHADINVSKLVVDEFVKDLIDHSGGVTGLADLSLSLDSTGDSPRNLSGTGQFNVYQGSVASFGKLQLKLHESNLIQQGLFGFNVNNLLQAMMPVKSGQFNEVSGKLSFSKGNIVFDQIRFEGQNLRMRAAGKFDFMAHNVNLDVAGDIPRVSASIIPGAIGEMSRKVTLQRMFSIVTFKKLKDLPALPLLGDIANDDPRAFTFSVATPTEPPKLMTDAVEKSFKWLPNKPFASAHPVPGI